MNIRRQQHGKFTSFAHVQHMAKEKEEKEKPTWQFPESFTCASPRGSQCWSVTETVFMMFLCVFFVFEELTAATGPP